MILNEGGGGIIVEIATYMVGLWASSCIFERYDLTFQSCFVFCLV